jgi:hypothetical protein
VSDVPFSPVGGNGRSPQSSDDSPVFQASVIDQMVSITPDGDPRLVLSVTIVSRLKNPQDPAAGYEPHPSMECEVWVTLAGADERRLGMALRDLKRLGFDGDDVSRLHPEHPQSFSLLGKSVLVRPRVVGGIEYWNLFWPRVKSQPAGLSRLQETAVCLKEKITSLKKSPTGHSFQGKGSSGSETPGPYQDAVRRLQ